MMRMKKYIGLAAVVLLAASMSIPAHAGELKRDDVGLWYQKDDSSYAVGWLTDEDGSTYYFDESGYAKTGWFTEYGKTYYFRPENGKMAAGYATVIDRRLYFFDENGVSRKQADKYTGWMKDDSHWYYRLDNGSMFTNGWKSVDGLWYYFDENGYMVTGPKEIDGVWYYMEDNGAMLTNAAREIDGVMYAFDGSGAGTAGGVVHSQNAALGLTYTTPAVPAESEKSEAHKAADQYADSVLAQILTDGMTKRQKAEAIYAWVRGNFRYAGSSATRDWGQEAYEGFRRRRGDCFTYFSVSHELLTRAGIESMMILRNTDNHHYWNLVLVEEGWYHFDTCPRSAGGYFCLWTDKQMADYSAQHKNCFAFDRSLYPQIQ